MQQYADIYLLQSHYMFRVSQHPSSGVLKTGTATSLQRGPIGPGWSCSAYRNILVQSNRHNSRAQHKLCKSTFAYPRRY